MRKYLVAWNNKEVYSGSDLEMWKDRNDILPIEKYLIDKYIKNKKSTIIEAGTGGGRLSLYLESKSFENIEAFDFVQEMIKCASKKSNKINFYVADATDLSAIQNESFDYAIYLQQIISLIPPSQIDKALDEVYRILANDGIVIFSFLNFNARKINLLLSFVVNAIRYFRKEECNKFVLPWLKFGGKINLHLFQKGQPTTYWFNKDDILKKLKRKSLNVLEVIHINEKNKEGMIYIVCQK